MRIQHNIAAMNAYRNYNNNASGLNRNLEKLSSGYRINRAGDDAAGLAISEKMRAQITGLDAAGKNVKDGISLVKTAEGAMQEVHDMLGRMKYLATQSSNGTYQDDVDRANIQKEVNSLLEEINRIADSANFNGQKLLNGELDSNAQVTEFGGIPPVGSNLDTNTRLNLPKNDNTKGTEFSVDFGNVKLQERTNTTDTGSLTIQVGTITMSLTASSGAPTWGDNVNLGKVFQDAIAKLSGSSTTSLTDSNVNIQVSGLTFNTSTTGTNAGLTSGWYLGSSAQKGLELTIGAGTGNGVKFTQKEAVSDPAGMMDGDMAVSVGTGSGAFAISSSMTYNNKTVEVYNAALKTNGQLASTHIKLTKDMIKMGSGIKIGKTTYTFDDGKAGVKVDDLLKKNEEGTLSDDDMLRQVTERLSVAAKDNEAWKVTTSVNGKPGEIMLREQDDAATKGYDFSNLNNIKASIGLSIHGEGLNLQIGDTSDAYNQMKVGVKDMHVKTLGIENLDVSTSEAAHNAIDKIKSAIDSVSQTRGDLGAIQNRLEHTANNLSVMKENIQDAESTIRDTDVADEMMKYTKNNILLQSAQAMLAQANQVPQGVLQLLQ